MSEDAVTGARVRWRHNLCPKPSWPPLQVTPSACQIMPLCWLLTLISKKYEGIQAGFRFFKFAWLKYSFCAIGVDDELPTWTEKPRVDQATGRLLVEFLIRHIIQIDSV